MTTIIEAARTGLDAHQVRHTLTRYRRLHRGEDPEAVASRTAAAQTMTNQYYDLVTNFYEYQRAAHPAAQVQHPLRAPRHRPDLADDRHCPGHG